MDCCGQWISLTAVKFSCQDQAEQRTETPANRLSAAVSITTEPWVHGSKGTKEVHSASCLDFHGFINLSHEGRELAKEKIPVPVVSHHCLSWDSPRRGKLRAPPSLWPCFFMCLCISRLPFQGWPSLSSPWGQGWKGTLQAPCFDQLPICIKLIRNWFFETCQAHLELLSSSINKRGRPGGKRSQERDQNNHSHKDWVTACACFRKWGFPPLLLSLQLCHHLSPCAFLPQAPSEPAWVHHWRQRTLLHEQNPKSQTNHCNSRAVIPRPFLDKWDPAVSQFPPAACVLPKPKQQKSQQFRLPGDLSGGWWQAPCLS